MAVRSTDLAGYTTSSSPCACHSFTYDDSEVADRAHSPDNLACFAINRLASLLPLKIFLGQTKRLTSHTTGQNDSQKQSAQQPALEG